MAVSKVESRTVSECSLNNITSMDPLNEEWYENLIIDHMTEKLGYEHLYGPDVRRTDDSYRDVFLPDILPDALRRINRNLPEAAVEEAIRKIQNIEIGSLEQCNEICNQELKCTSLTARKSAMTSFGCLISTILRTTISTS